MRMWPHSIFKCFCMCSCAFCCVRVGSVFVPQSHTTMIIVLVHSVVAVPGKCVCNYLLLMSHLAPPLLGPPPLPFSEVSPTRSVHGTSVLQSHRAGFLGSNTDPEVIDRWEEYTRVHFACLDTNQENCLQSQTSIKGTEFDIIH